MEDLTKKIKAVKQIAADPSQKWLRDNRQVLLSKISQTKTDKKRHFNSDQVWSMAAIFLPRNFVYSFVRPVVAGAMVLAIGTSGWIATVAASQDSLPGEILYSAKRVTEKTHMVVVAAVGAKETETKMRVEHAKRRAVEAKQLVKSKDPEKIKKASEPVHDLKVEIKKIDEDLETIKKEEAAGEQTVSADVVKELSQSADEIGVILDDVKKDLQDTASSTPGTDITVVNSDLKEVTKITKQTSVKAVEVMVGKHLRGDKTVSEQEVKYVIEEKVKKIAGDADENKKEVDKVNDKTKQAVKVKMGEIKEETADNLASTSTDQVAIDKSDALAKYNIKEGDRLVEVSKQTNDAAEKVDEATKNINGKVAEANALISEGNLKKAVEVIVEASKTSEEVIVTTAQTLKSYKEVEPIVTETVLSEATSSSKSVVEDLEVETNSTTTKVEEVIESEVK